MTEKKKTAEKKETVMPEPTGKDMINGIVQCMNQINMLANYINDYIEFQDSTEKFKGFIIEKYKGYGGDRYSLHSNSMWDLTIAVRKLLALDTLNEDKEKTSYHLQEVDAQIVNEPLVLTDEVKEDKQENAEMPF